MGVFYILIFGLMFADVGYGLTLTVGCLLGLKLMRPKESLAALSPDVRNVRSCFNGRRCALRRILR